MTESITVTAARSDLSKLINKVAFAKERISLTRQNKSVAYLISPEDMRLLELLELLEDKADLLELENNLHELKEPKITYEAFKAGLGL